MTHVFLHIGAFKTGTSFIQKVLDENRDVLADEGVLFPGRKWSWQVHAATSLARPDPGLKYDWPTLARDVDAWPGRAAIVSMEFLSLAPRERATRALEALSANEVTVVLTLRDLGRVIPAQWQESIQNNHSWRYRPYIEGVLGPASRRNRAGAHFWRRQDWPNILRTWGQDLPPDRLVVVTVPPPGSPTGLLWERMCSVFGLPPGRFDTSPPVNEAIGAASAEVLRRVNERIATREADQGTYRVLKKTLAKQVLAGLRDTEPTLVLPAEHLPAVNARTAELLEQVSELRPTVVGDLAELMPTTSRREGTVDDPETLGVDALLDPATAALAEMVRLLGGTKQYAPDEDWIPARVRTPGAAGPEAS